MRLLIIEDEENLAFNIQKILQKEGYVVDVIFDGETGSEQAYVEDYDLIILDIMLPRKDGLIVLQELRQDKKSTPVLLLTAKRSLEDKVKGLDLGADDYLVKPFALAELLARVRALLRRNLNDKSPILSVADLTLNTLTHEVFRAGQLIRLTPKEYALLEFLLRNKNRVLTRITLAEHVWGDNFDIMTNFIDVHIKNLRQKMDSNFSVKLIHTVRGIGYMLKEE